MTDQPSLFGREDELAVLTAAVAAGQAVVVRGEAGIGKSALLNAAIVRSSRNVVFGRGIRALSEVSYIPLRQAFYDLPRVGEPVDIVGFIRAEHPSALLVVDDLHWCDPDTLAVLEEICLTLPLVATVRSQSPECDVLVGRLSEVGTMIDLGPLHENAARRIADECSRGAPPSDIDRWVAGASGNPLMIELAAASGVDATGARPGAVMLDAMATLEPGAIEAAARLALAASPLAVDDRFRRALVAHRFVDVLADGRVELRHDLIADAALKLVDDDVRRTIHSELAESASNAAERARHLDGAGRAEAVIEAARIAAAEASTVWSRARYLLLAAQNAEPNEHLALRVDAAEQLSLSGQYREVVAVLENVDLGADADLAIRGGVALTRAYWTESQIDQARESMTATLRRVEGTGSAAEGDLLSLQSRIVARLDWDLETSIALGRRALEIAQECGSGLVAAHSAIGLAMLMANNPDWAGHLETAGALSRQDHDLHSAVVTYDTLLFGHLLAGDPSRCRPLADEMVRATEIASPAWNGYFRASGLTAALHIDGDYPAVLEQGRRLLERRLTTRTREMATSNLAIARADTGDIQGAIELAELAVERASDDAARSTACWALAEAHWLDGSDAAIAISETAIELPVGGYPGRVSAVLIGQWARADHGLRVDPRADAVMVDALPSLQGAVHEVRGLATDDPEAAFAAFADAAAAWAGRSRRAMVRAHWAAGEAALRIDRADLATAHLLAAEEEARAIGLVPMGRRIARAQRALGRVSARSRRTGDLSEIQLQVMRRIARGQTTRQIARALAVEPSTVDSHIRASMRATHAATRLQAAAVALGRSPDQPEARRISAVSRDDQALAERIAHHTRAGATIRDFAALPPEPWLLTPQHLVATGTVATIDDVALAVLAAARGAQIVVRLPADLDLTAALVDSLQRVGEVELLAAEPDEPRAAIDPLALQAFDLLAAGLAIAEIAGEVGYSRRTIERRLAAARARLGVETNIEALLLLRTG